MQIESSDSPYFMKFFAKETDPSRPTVPTNWGVGKRKGYERAGLQWPNQTGYTDYCGNVMSVLSGTFF